MTSQTSDPARRILYWISITVVAIVVGVGVTLTVRKLVQPAVDVQVSEVAQDTTEVIQAADTNMVPTTPDSTIPELQETLPQVGETPTKNGSATAPGLTTTETHDPTPSASDTASTEASATSTPVANSTTTVEASATATSDEPAQVTPTDEPTYPQGIEDRPYTSDSVWNTPISQNPQYDPHSPEMIATIGMDSGGRITSDPDQYSYPVYYADETTPRWDIPCTRYKCTVVTLGSITTQRKLYDVPIPTGATPSVGSDGQMIIIDTITNTEYDLWQVVHTSDGWSVSNGSVYNITWDGMPSRYGSRGAGVPYLAGLVRPFEITRGKIEHALAVAYSYAANDRCVFPATKTDGKSNLQYAIPQGARIRLDPSLTEADFDHMGLNRTGKIIARALQEYGMFLIDNSGRPKIYVEDLKNNPYSQVQWSDQALSLTSTTIASIPLTSFRVLKLPEIYWGEGTQGDLHGECFFDPALSLNP